jgi:hypothetical protein
MNKPISEFDPIDNMDKQELREAYRDALRRIEHRNEEIAELRSWIRKGTSGYVLRDWVIEQMRESVKEIASRSLSSQGAARLYGASDVVIATIKRISEPKAG